MNFLRTLGWIALTTIVVVFSLRNWSPVTINLFGNLQADVKLPVLLLIFFLLGFILVGGAYLFYAIWRDQRRNEEVRRFFSTFTHELKTSLTSLRLQAEILEEDPRNRENENLRRLLRDVVRLELQLENALVLAQAESGKLFLEEIPLKKTVEQLAVHWPDLEIRVSGDAQLRADQVLQDKLRSLKNVDIHISAQTTEITGDGERVSGLTYKNRVSGQERHVELEGVFVQIGLVPNTEWLKDSGLELSHFGEIRIDEKAATNLPGVFAAGDCTTVPYKQIIIAMGEGSKAALSAFDYIIRNAPAEDVPEMRAA